MIRFCSRGSLGGMRGAARESGMRYVCGWCGSDQVTRDAWAEWDVAARRWVLGAVFDDAYCHRCEAERSIEEADAADVDADVM